MKYLLIIPLFFLYVIAIAQVPPNRGTYGETAGDFGLSIGVPGPAKSNYKGVGSYKQDGKYGFYFPGGVKHPAIYDKINSGSNGFVVQKGKLYGIADRNGNIIGKIEYDSIGSTYERAYVVKKGGKYGTISEGGNKILSLRYDKVLSVNSFVSFVQTRNGQVQMIFNEQEKAFSPKIDYAAVYSNLVIVKANGKFGVVKKQWVVPLEYDSIFVSSMHADNRATRSTGITKRASPIRIFGDFMPNNLLTVQKNNKYGLVDSDGAVVYTADNDAVYNNSSYKFYTAKKGNLYGIYFMESKKKTEIEFEHVYADGVGYVMATKNRKSGVFDLQGKQIVACEYDPEFIMQYRMGFRVSKNKKRGIVGKDGAVLVPLIYDDVDPFFESELNEFVKVKSGEKYGILSLKGKIIIPVAFEWIGEENGFLKVLTPDKRCGLYDKTGKVIIPADYQWISDSDSRNGNILILKKKNNSYNFLNKNTRQVMLKENADDYGYVHNQDGLLNPFSSTNKCLLLVKDHNGKFGMLNEITGALDVPMVYDEIIRRFDGGKSIFFSVRKGKKYGLVDDKDRQVIPVQYDAINIDLMYPDDEGRSDAAYSVIVAKGNKFGTVNLENKILIPFQYDNLQRISHSGRYKAKVGSHYRIIDAKNKIVSNGPFDEVANFERTGGSDYTSKQRDEALTFYKGKMRVIDDKGKFVTTEVAMQPHIGYKTFDELKWALLNALNSKDEKLLKDFAAKIAPSDHILFYLKENPFSRNPLLYTDVNAVKEKYFSDLLQFKSRELDQDSRFSYNRESLTEVRDYTLYKDGLVTNNRTTDHAFGSSRFMEKVLRNALKINGYWISSYFMIRNFDDFRP